MTIILHIGIHKTGTSSIQRFASENRDELRKRGLWYPSYAEIGLADRYGHHLLAHTIADVRTDRFSLDNAQQFIETIRANKAPGETVLISSEPMYRHVLGDPSEHYWSRRRKYINNLRDIIGESDVKILAVFRRQDDFIQSFYQERIRKSQYHKRFLPFLKEEELLLDYHANLKLFGDFFSDLKAIIFEDIRKPNLVESFFEALGIDVTDLDTSFSANRSLPVELVEYKRLFNKASPDDASMQRLTKKLSKFVENGGAESGDRVNWLSVQDRIKLVESFADGNERLRREYTNGHSAPLFPPLEVSQSTPSETAYSGMSLNRFAQLTTEIFLDARQSNP